MRKPKRPARNTAQLLYEGMSEADLQESVRKAALSLGWRFYHPWDTRNSEEGWPDCFVLRGSRVMVIELKTEKGEVTPAQREYLTAFVDAHIEAWVVRPSDMDWLLEKLR